MSNGRPTVIIGAGIVGSAIALRLSDLGRDVILIDRDKEPHGASSAAFAAIGAFDAASRETYLLEAFGMAEWRRWEHRLGPAAGVRWTGDLRWATSVAAGVQLQEKTERARMRGYPVRDVSEDEMGHLAPGLEPGAVVASSFSYADGQVDPGVVLARLRALLEASGAEMIFGQRALIEVALDRVLVRLPDQVIEPETIVIAAGAEAQALARRSGLEVPLKPSPGILAVTAPVPPVLEPTIRTNDDHGGWIAVRQRRDGRVLIMHEGPRASAVEPTRDHAHELIRQASRVFPAFARAQLETIFLQWRAMPADGLPIIGRLPELPAVYAAVMHPGVTLAPGAARLIAEEITQGEDCHQLGPFRPGRFPEHIAQEILDLEEVFRIEANDRKAGKHGR